MKFVITGKPEIGKTTIAHIMECEFTKKIALVPDALDMVKLDLKSLLNSKFASECYIRAEYHLRVEMENIISSKNADRLILCDHGTLDGLALWSKSVDEFFKELNTDLQKELERYDGVICLTDVGEGMEYQNLSHTKLNPINFWKQHPRYLQIPSKRGFSYCYNQVNKILTRVLHGDAFEVIRNDLNNENKNSFDLKKIETLRPKNEEAEI